MRCPSCEAETPAAVFCCRCGVKLTYSDSTQTSLGEWWSVGIFMLIVAFAVAVIRFSAGSSTASTKEHTTSVACACAYSAADAAGVSNTATLAGMTPRREAIQLSEHTTIHVLSVNAGAASVLVKSGQYSGEHCYLPERVIN